jgi:hypothetical protein
MSGNLPPLRKRAGRTASPARAARSVGRISRLSMLERREGCLADIARLRSGASSPLLDKAQQLLTRYWWPASWRCRADVLRSAEWLVRISGRNAGSGGLGGAEGASFVPHHVRNVDPSDGGLVP